MDKNGPLQTEKEWGPLPSGWGSPLSEKEQQEGKANQALLRLLLDTRYYLGLWGRMTQDLFRRQGLASCQPIRQPSFPTPGTTTCIGCG